MGNPRSMHDDGVFESSFQVVEVFGLPVINGLEKFKLQASFIFASRRAEDLGDVTEKVHARDIFGAHS
jgi:hypothetical protein